jgi:hypothetical protein
MLNFRNLNLLDCTIVSQWFSVDVALYHIMRVFDLLADIGSNKSWVPRSSLYHLKSTRPYTVIKSSMMQGIASSSSSCMLELSYICEVADGVRIFGYQF